MFLQKDIAFKYKFEELNDTHLITIANKRMANYDSTNLISEKEMNDRLGISENDLAGFEKVNIE